MPIRQDDVRTFLHLGYTGATLYEQSHPLDLPLLSKSYQRDELANKLRVVLGR